MAKINDLELKNFRGVRTELKLDLPGGQSLVIYGDNATGKSSFLDAIEWYVTDAVSHLSSEEVETHGGLKNALAKEADESFVAVSFIDPNLKNKKSLTAAKGKFKSEFSDKPTPEFDSLLAGLSEESIWIRNKELVEFILGTKSDRLNDLSAIIGFEEVSATKATLRKAASDIRSVIRSKNFEASINSEKRLIGEKLGAIINNEVQFLKAATDLLATIAPETKVSTLQDLELAVKSLAQGQESLQAQQFRLLQDAEATGVGLEPAISAFGAEITAYSTSRDKLKLDGARLKQVSMSALLDEAVKVLAQHDEDSCPLCLQLITKKELGERISKRIAELKYIQNEVTSLETARRQVLSRANSLLANVEKWTKQLAPLKDTAASTDLASLDAATLTLREVTKDLLITPLQQQLTHEVDTYKTLINLTRSLVLAAKSTSADLAKQVSDARIEVVAKLSVAKASFEKTQALSRESDILTSQQKTIETLTSEFTARQRDGMKAFLSAISKAMNEYYLFMNPDEKVKDIELVCLDDKLGEFSGVALNFHFHGQPAASPRKLLSESHINCIGLCLFLSTARAFNNIGNFIVLDDVISSFDKNHRALFARLLVTKFSDYQLFILTHETEWYEYLSSLVKAPAWRVLRTHWNAETGTSLTESAGSLRCQIDEKLKTGEEGDLGNLIRRYAERQLKEISQEIEAPVSFKFNERNESRTFDEMYSAVRSQLRKHSNLADHEAVAELATCQFFSNKASHDNTYRPNIADLKLAMSDLDKFLVLFLCPTCEHIVGIKFHNAPEKKITCKCGHVSLAWK